MKLGKRLKKLNLVQLTFVAVMVLALGYFFLKPEVGGTIMPLAVVHEGEITYPGDTFEHSFVLTNGDELDANGNPVSGTAMALPDLDNSDGTVVRLYKSYRMVDQASNKVQGCDLWTTQTDCETHGCGWYVDDNACSAYEFLIDTELPSGQTTSLSINLPIVTTTPSGWYAATAILFKVDQIWDRDTNTSTTGNPVMLDKQAVKFEVQTPTAAPRPGVSAILSWLNNIFASIVNWILGLFA